MNVKADEAEKRLSECYWLVDMTMQKWLKDLGKDDDNNNKDNSEEKEGKEERKSLKGLSFTSY